MNKWQSGWVRQGEKKRQTIDKRKGRRDERYLSVIWRVCFVAGRRRGIFFFPVSYYLTQTRLIINTALSSSSSGSGRNSNSGDGVCCSSTIISSKYGMCRAVGSALFLYCAFVCIIHYVLMFLLAVRLAQDR